VLGAAFLALEIREFAGMIAHGAGPQRSAFLSAFFALVGCHGLHVTAGLIWLAVMMAQVAVMGFRAAVQRRLQCFSLFWHALDIRVPLGLAVLAIAQMGVHLVFFLHITTGPDNTNNVLALAFGILIVFKRY
jgi:heme/copper-type cytochrome/quinol oxidase subunit 3